MSAETVTESAAERHLSAVLAELTFPAHRWQVIMTAEDYGADAHTITALRGLAAPGYHGVRSIAAELAGRRLGAPRQPRTVEPAARDGGP